VINGLLGSEIIRKNNVKRGMKENIRIAENKKI